MSKLKTAEYYMKKWGCSGKPSEWPGILAEIQEDVRQVCGDAYIESLGCEGNNLDDAPGITHCRDAILFAGKVIYEDHDKSEAKAENAAAKRAYLKFLPIVDDLRRKLDRAVETLHYYGDYRNWSHKEGIAGQQANDTLREIEFTEPEETDDDGE